MAKSYLFLVLIFVLTLLNILHFTRALNSVTCHSVFKLKNIHHNRIRLHSPLDVRFSSGNQGVTGTQTIDSVNSLWRVKGTRKLSCTRGEPVPCGALIRLEHLQSHQITSHVSEHQEVFAKDDEQGSTSDIWEVFCEEQTWQRHDKVQFRHVDTESYLSLSGQTFERPLRGHFEIVAAHSDDSSYWKAIDGVFFKQTETDTNTKSYEHNEL